MKNTFMQICKYYTNYQYKWKRCRRMETELKKVRMQDGKRDRI